MKWYKSRAMYLSGLLGFTGGIVFLVAGLWLEFNRQHLTPALWSFLYIHRIQPMTFILDLAPLVFAAMAGLIGFQRGLSAELKQAKLRLDVIFDSFSDLIFLVDTNNVILRCNLAVVDRLNTRYINVIGRPLFEILGNSYLDSPRQESTDFQWLKRSYDMSMFPVQVDGAEPQSLFVLHDITARKEAEVKLEQSETLFRALFDRSPDAILLIDPHNPDVSWPVIDCNSATCLMNGFSREELIGHSIDLLNGTTGTQEERTAYLTQLREAGSLKLEADHRRKDGTVFRVDVSTSLIMIRGRELVIGIDRDITEKKRAEAELLREKKFLEALIKESPASIVVLDKNHRVISVNPAFEKLYGYENEEVVGASLDTLITTEGTLEEALKYSQQAMVEPVHAISQRRRKNGELVDVEIMGVPVVVSGESVATLAIYHDISELVRARHEAEQANRSKSEFLANMSHEIRTPMNGIMGMLELALDTRLTTEQNDYLQTSLHSAEVLLSLLNDILDFSKIESGRLELESIDFNLRNSIEDVTYTLAKRAHDKGLEIACLVDPDLTSTLRGDPGRLRQVLVNLVGNAIKFTHQGEIVIRAEPLHEETGHVSVHFSVQDTGVGIPYERQAAVFERFAQADGSTTRTYGGTGLGLAISKQLVEAMGGKIGLESKPGIGSIFWFDVKFEKRPREKRGDTAPLVLGRSNLTQVRILVVDDNQINRLVLTKNVEALGSRVDVVSSGAKALESLRNAQRAGDPYHVILLDMQMPGMDGEQTARAIKSDPSVKDVKIIVLTSMGQRGDVVRLEALGCSGYLLKPVKQQTLFDAVVAVLGRKEDLPSGLITRHLLSEKRKQSLRLLLAEDNPINQKLAILLLQKAGYSIDAVETGVQAFEKIQANSYSAVLMDVQMPDMDGIEATRRIRAWEQNKGQHIPIIAMTAHALKGDRERCIEAGMDDYVAKPIESRILYNVLDRWLENKSSKILQTISSAEQKFSMDLDDGLFGEEVAPASHLTEKPVSTVQTNTPPEFPVDLNAALIHFDGDREFMLDMCKDFRDHLPGTIEQIKSAFNHKDINGLHFHAHSLKGVSLNFDAIFLAELAAQLEQLCKREDIATAPSLIHQIETEAARARDFLGQTMDKMEAA